MHYFDRKKKHYASLLTDFTIFQLEEKRKNREAFNIENKTTAILNKVNNETSAIEQQALETAQHMSKSLMSMYDTALNAVSGLPDYTAEAIGTAPDTMRNTVTKAQGHAKELYNQLSEVKD